METFDAVEVILIFFITAKKTLWDFASLLFPSQTKFSEANFGIKIRPSAHIYMTHIYIYTYTNLRKTYWQMYFQDCRCDMNPAGDLK